MTSSDDFLKWFVDTPTYFGRGEYFEGDEPPNLSFVDILGLKPDNLKAYTKDVFEHLEDDDKLHELKLGLEAYSQFQDIMEIAIHGDNPLWNRHYCYYESLVYLRESIVSWLDENILAATILLRPFLELAILHLYWYLRCQFQDIMEIAIHGDNPLWNRHYCYYESLVYLRESIVSWLDENILAATILLRPFLELAILHLYWYLRCEASKKRYDDFYLWLHDKKGKPPFKNQLDYVFENLPSRNVVSSKRIDQIKQLLQNAYKSISAYNHSPKVEEKSIVSLSGGLGNTSLFSFFYYLSTLNVFLRQVTYLYLLAYPMSVFPVDRYKKWGIGGPLGLYFDFNNVAKLEAYLDKNNVEKIRSELAQLQTVREQLEWFETQPNITSEEIESEWKRFVEDGHTNVEENDWRHRIAFHKTHSRSLGWFTNYLHDTSDPDDKVSDELLNKAMGKLRNW